MYVPAKLGERILMLPTTYHEVIQQQSKALKQKFPGLEISDEDFEEIVILDELLNYWVSIHRSFMNGRSYYEYPYKETSSILSDTALVIAKARGLALLVGAHSRFIFDIDEAESEIWQDSTVFDSELVEHILETYEDIIRSGLLTSKQLLSLAIERMVEDSQIVIEQHDFKRFRWTWSVEG
jgi:hypothetical protein